MPSTPIPMPADFRAWAKRPVEDASKHFGVSRRIITRWRKELGVARAGRKPVPADFAERAVGARDNALTKIYGCDVGTIADWRKIVGVPNDYVPPKRPMPGNFAELAPDMTLAECRREWRADPRIIKRWFAEIGCAPRPQVRVPPPPRYRPNTPVSLTATAATKAMQVRVMDAREVSLYGMAQRFLQRITVCHRCDAAGKYQDRRNTHWRFGRLVLTDQELLAEAVRRGFDPEAWSRLAA